MRSASNWHRHPPGAGSIPAPRADARHFAALCRGAVVLVGLALPVALTLAFASPPGRADGHAPDAAAARVASPEDAAPRVSRLPQQTQRLG